MTINTQALLDDLLRLKEKSSPDSETYGMAQQWTEAIEKKRKYLNDKSHKIVFIGSVGVGKSSLIGIAANLLVGPQPRDRASLKNHSVLAIGSGRTTVCEVCIRAGHPDDQSQLGLVIKPFSTAEMEKEIQIFAETEWRRRQPGSQRGTEDDSDPTAQEVHRAIRGMTGYSERQESYQEGGTRKRRKVDPLDQIVPNHKTASEFANHLIERTHLAERNQTEWWWDDAFNLEYLKALKIRFEAINQGSEPAAMLPYRMTVVVPRPLPVQMQDDLDVTLIDTRGLDGPAESRADLQELLRDSRAIVVLCASFKDAPGDTIRGLLRSMAADAELRDAISRTLLILLDQGDADQVNGAEGEREYGQELKIDECHIALEGVGLTREIEKSQIVAFDVLKDDPDRLRNGIYDRLTWLRGENERQLHEQIENAQRFLDDHADQSRPGLLSSMDERIKAAMARYLPTEMPLGDPLHGMYKAIRAERWASVVYATCRRDGSYSKLDLYAAVRAEASRAATAWLDRLFTEVNAELRRLENEPSFAAVSDVIRLRKQHYRDAQIKVVSLYAESVFEEARKALEKDPAVWGTCRDEWGGGIGFVTRVLRHLENWSRRQQNISAHEKTEAPNLIPLWGEVARPAQPPRFTLRVSNLRSLRKVEWCPEPLAVLIGANGTGKTTLLQSLRLLRLAYERGLPEAVRQVFGGGGNLKSWGCADDEKIEIGINIGDASWHIELVPREGSVIIPAPENLTAKGREIFSRDILGAFLFGEERVEASPKLLGLRILMDRGVHDSSVRMLAKFFQRIAIYSDFDLWTIRQGSKTIEDSALFQRGDNALALLRRWHQELDNRHRYEFVVEGLAAAFPNTFSEMDFVEAGTTVAARIYAPGRERPSPLEDEANGVLQLLVLFCAIAGAEDESLIAIDEPENALHPYALRVLLRRTERWARQHNLTVLLATHSTVLLDALTGNSQQVFVMKAPERGEGMPTRLDQLCNPDWLDNFKLGDLYEEGEIGSNADED